jgi:hypothetical protein
MSQPALERPESTPAGASAVSDAGDREHRTAESAKPRGGADDRRAVDSRGAAPSRQPNRQPGVTGRGVVVLILIVTALAGLLDMAISGHRGPLFGIVFVVASGVGAVVTRRRDLPTAMVAPPLIYCVAIALMSVIDRDGLSGGLLTTQAYYLGNAFVTGAPAIWTGTALACAIGWYRRRN